MKIDQDRLNKYMNKIHATTCPLCGNGQWTFNDTIFQLPEFDTKGLIVGGVVFPVIPLTCDNCGNTYFINVLSAGLMDKPKNSEEAVPDDKKK